MAAKIGFLSDAVVSLNVMAHHILVVGGNGFVGSSVCRAALSRGWQVTSISSSGRPFTTPNGHTPSWTSKVSWHAASALEPATYRSLLSGKTGVVHSVGILLDTDKYKDSLRRSDVLGLARELLSSATRERQNPLKPSGYDVMNRDTALRVCEAYVEVVAEPQASTSSSAELSPFPFVYVSAEDMGRPFIPQGYIKAKREAEAGIAALCRSHSSVRGVFVRPSFVYHAHLRPISSVIASLASLSATVHENAPNFLPTPSRILRALSSSSPSSSSAPSEIPPASEALAQTMELPPIHVDHVGEAVCRTIEDKSIEGVVGLRDMRRLAGLETQTSSSSSS